MNPKESSGIFGNPRESFRNLGNIWDSEEEELDEKEEEEEEEEEEKEEEREEEEDAN